MLENTFYTVEKTDSTQNTYRAEVRLNALHEIYKSHFPGNPITPGVCLLQIAIELLNLKFERDMRLTEAKSIKYLKVINPIENPIIEFVIQYKIQEDLIFADITIVNGKIVFSKINAIYKGL
jgi:3-hydroxyacyl-[acyl-carrier-protein] dehydratase